MTFATRVKTMATTRLDFTKPHVLRNAREYRAAVAEVDALLDRNPKAGTEAHERLEFLSVLVQAYEDEREPADETGTPQSVVDFMLEQRGMTRADLARLLGGRARVSEFFSGKRRLSIAQVRALRDELGIPADLLIA
jgi:HTH-type transcriptional regulator / antitoxin HigA